MCVLYCKTNHLQQVCKDNDAKTYKKLTKKKKRNICLKSVGSWKNCCFFLFQTLRRKLISWYDFIVHSKRKEIKKTTHYYSK